MSDWTILGGDPAPGNPAQLRLRVGQLDRVATTIDDVSRELSRIARGAAEASWRGEAAEAMRELLDAFRYDLYPVSTSFWNLTSTLGSHATELDDLQREARQALQRANVAEQRRRAAESSRRSAADALAQQRRALSNRRNAERLHAVQSAVVTVVDPAASMSSAQESQRLARESAQSAGAVNAAEGSLRRVEASLSQARADLEAEKRNAGSIHDRWDASSRRTAKLVEDGLSGQLRNASNVQKVLSKVGDSLEAIGRFVEDPLPYISELRDIIDKVQKWVSTASMIVAALAKIAGLLSFIPGMGAVAGALAALAAVLTVASFALAAAKLLTTMILWGNNFQENGRSKVSLGDFGLDLVTLGFAALPFKTGAAKMVTGVGTSSRAVQQAEVSARRTVVENLRRDIILRTGSSGDVARQAARDAGHVFVGVAGRELREGAEDATSNLVRDALDGRNPTRRYSVPLRLTPPLGAPVVTGPSGSGGGGAGW